MISYDWDSATPRNENLIHFLQYYIRDSFSAGINLRTVSSRRLTKPHFQPATWVPLQPNHTETPTHIEPRTIRPMWQFNRIVASS